jgi:hypothetical protein
LDLARFREGELTMESGNPGLLKCLLLPLRYRIGKRPFKADELAPVNLRFLALKTFSIHPAQSIDQSACSNEHLLRSASMKLAGSTERS